MSFIKENKITLIICASLLILGIVFYFHQRKIDSDEINYSTLELKDYKINEVIPLYISDEELAKKYLSDFVSLSISYPDKAYELLSDESKEAYPTLDSFKAFINSISRNKSFYSAKVKEYSKSSRDSKIYIIDIENNSFVFEQNGIMDYKVTIK